MEAVGFIPSSQQAVITDQTVTWSAPSNIALVKYWGKYDPQIPANPSLSFTLNHCKTKTSVALAHKDRGSDKSAQEFSFEFSFEGAPKPDFHPKIASFFTRVVDYLPFLKAYHIIIHSDNTFPHSSGIASSASAMAALSLCLLELSNEFPPDNKKNFSEAFYEKASFLARLGSGSAARSIRGPLMQWGKTTVFESSQDLIAVPFNQELAPIFKNFQDTILLVDKGEKVVSSTVGHGLMENHPFAEARFQQAHDQLAVLTEALVSGDMKKFIGVVESEALTLHAMMLTSNPYFILMKPGTLSIIEKIWAFRELTQIPVCFTLDAGANVHLLYPEMHKEQLLQFIENELVVHCQNGQYICDQVGSGSISHTETP
jgi:diphosphomevalonate decarboxylase